LIHADPLASLTGTVAGIGGLHGAAPGLYCHVGTASEQFFRPPQRVMARQVCLKPARRRVR
jgi:hypothetical protein